MDKRSLWIIAWLLGLCQLGTLALMLQTLRGEFNDRFLSDAQLTLTTLAHTVNDQTERSLTAAESAVRNGAELIQQEVLRPAHDDQLERFLVAQLHAADELAGMFIGRPDGSFVYVARNEHGLRSKIIRFPDGERKVSIVQRSAASGEIIEQWEDLEDDYDPRTRSWYQKATDASELVWTDPYRFFSSGQPGITAALDTGTGLVLGADVDIHELSGLLARIPLTRNGRAMIIDARRHVVTATDSRRLASAAADSGMPTFEQVAAPPLLALDAAFQENEATTADHLVEYSVDEQAYWGLVRPFTLAGGQLNWTLLVQVASDEYVGTLVRRILLFSLAILALGLLCLLALFLRQQRREHLAANPLIDPRSGALSLSAFRTVVRKILARSPTKNGSPGSLVVAIVMVEIGRLQHFFDSHGDDAGARLVRATCDNLQELLTPDEYLGRASDNRFALLLFADSDEAMRVRIERCHAVTAACVSSHSTEDRFSNMPAGSDEADAGNSFDRSHQAHEDSPEMLLASNANPDVSSHGTLSINTGAALLESAEPIDNLEQRARHALTEAVGSRTQGCIIAARMKSDPPTPLQQVA